LSDRRSNVHNVHVGVIFRFYFHSTVLLLFILGLSIVGTTKVIEINDICVWDCTVLAWRERVWVW
jgi:hypothetical protein